MLGILRGTQKALFFACICLLVCSFERLSRYEFASRAKEEEDPHLVRPTTTAQKKKKKKEPPSSGEDHFVSWAGSISNHWERTVEQGLLWHNHNRFLSKLFGFGGFSFSSHQSIVPASSDKSQSGRSRSSAASDMLTTSLTTRILNYQDLVAPIMAQNHIHNNHPDSSHATVPLAEAKLVLRRQIRQSQKMQATTSSGGSDGPPRKSELDETREARRDKLKLPPNIDAKKEDFPSSVTSSNHQKLPRIGFLLHLRWCDRQSIQHWQTVWINQLNGRDQPFLFHILLPANTSQENCWKELQVEPGKAVDNSMMNYNISQDEPMATACKSPNEWLDRFHVEELLYHDGSKAKARLRSSTNMRLFRKNHGDTIAPIAKGQGSIKSQIKSKISVDTESDPSTSFATFFQCPEGAHTSTRCDDSVLDCPSSFQFVPPPPHLAVVSKLDSKSANNNGASTLPNQDAFRKSSISLEATIS